MMKFELELAVMLISIVVTNEIQVKLSQIASYDVTTIFYGP